jgi:WD40 repeat protein
LGDPWNSEIHVDILFSTGKGMDKIAQVAFHSTAKNLLTAVTNDAGSASLRLFDLASSEETLVIPLETPGVFNMTWSPLGDRVAISTKDGRIIILNPRDPSDTISGKAHDSPRSFQLAWISPTHLLSVGFSRGSQRKINLYTLTSTTLTTSYSHLIDTSPSVLFPIYDPDTSILYIWGKGERQIQAFEIHPENTNEPIQNLPGYTAGNPQLGVSFGRKGDVDVRKVEVGKCLRLTGKTLEEVSWSIPRNKVGYCF